ncbi:MAG: G5 domain-containing protein [Defluviitaleaceae bacterium]|nr:G5 domain-containing protein [Defluviitaleaceae bacterium]
MQRGSKPVRGSGAPVRKKTNKTVAVRSKKRQSRKTSRKGGLLGSLKQLNIKLIGLCSLALLIVILSIFIFTRNNAYRILVNEQEIGIIRRDRNVDLDELVEFAVFAIENDISTRILKNEEVKFVPARANNRQVIDVNIAIMRISGSITYKVEAVAIEVDGVTMALLLNEEQAETVKNRVVQRFIPNDSTIERFEFLEDYTHRRLFVELDELNTQSEAYNALTATNRSLVVHTVQSGENLTIIAARHGTTVEAILALNPGRSANDILGLGAQLVLSLPVPVLSVVTYERITFLETIPRETTNIENNNMNRGQNRVVQHGQDGEAYVTALRVRVNGIEDISRFEEINREITVEPVPEIVEIGMR